MHLQLAAHLHHYLEPRAFLGRRQPGEPGEGVKLPLDCGTVEGRGRPRLVLPRPRARAAMPSPAIILENV